MIAPAVGLEPLSGPLVERSLHLARTVDALTEGGESWNSSSGLGTACGK